MRFVVDAHTVLWFLAGDIRLSANARTVLEDEANDAFVSVATLWEIAIKVSINKLSLNGPFSSIFPALAENNLPILAISASHLQQVLALPYPPNHRDPFDKLVIAQAMVEDLVLLSRDRLLDAYGIQRFW